MASTYLGRGTPRIAIRRFLYYTGVTALCIEAFKVRDVLLQPCPPLQNA